MPSDLTTPITINTGAPNTASEISIQEIVIHPPKGDMPGSITLCIAEGSGPSAYRIPGVFNISDNNDDETLKEIIGGHQFDIPLGSHFSDAASASPVGDTVYEVIKHSCYTALASRYPTLQGDVS